MVYSQVVLTILSRKNPFPTPLPGTGQAFPIVPGAFPDTRQPGTQPVCTNRVTRPIPEPGENVFSRPATNGYMQMSRGSNPSDGRILHSLVIKTIIPEQGGFKYEVQHGLMRRKTPRGVS